MENREIVQLIHGHTCRRERLPCSLFPFLFSALSALQTVDFFARRTDSQRRSLQALFAPCLSSAGCLLFVTGY